MHHHAQRTRITSDTPPRPASSQLVAKHAFRTACGSHVELTDKVLQHLAAHPDVVDILPDAIGKIRLPFPQSFAEVEVDMGRIVGISSRVQTPLLNPDGTAQFALRKGRQLPSRVVTGVSGMPTQKVVVIVKKTPGSRFSLVTSWIGSLAKKEPWDPTIRSPKQFQECLDFWCRHALIHDPDTMGPVFESSWNQIAAFRADIS